MAAGDPLQEDLGCRGRVQLKVCVEDSGVQTKGLAGGDAEVVLGRTGALGVLAGVVYDAGTGELPAEDLVGVGEGHVDLEVDLAIVLVLEAGDVLHAGVVEPFLLPLLDLPVVSWEELNKLAKRGYVDLGPEAAGCTCCLGGDDAGGGRSRRGVHGVFGGSDGWGGLGFR